MTEHQEANRNRAPPKLSQDEKLRAKWAAQVTHNVFTWFVFALRSDTRRDANMPWQDAKREARNQLKMELQDYQDVWEYKRVKIGPIWFTRKVLKEKTENRLAEERAKEISELQPELDEVQTQPTPYDRYRL